MGEFFQLQDLAAIAPELALTVFGLALLLLDLIVYEKRTLGYFALAGIAFSGILLFRLDGVNVSAYGDQLAVDPFAAYFKFLFLIAAGLTIGISTRYLDIEGEQHGEYYVLILFATMGMMFMAGGTDLVTLYIGLETMAIGSLLELAGQPGLDEELATARKLYGRDIRSMDRLLGALFARLFRHLSRPKLRHFIRPVGCVRMGLPFSRGPDVSGFRLGTQLRLSSDPESPAATVSAAATTANTAHAHWAPRGNRRQITPATNGNAIGRTIGWKMRSICPAPITSKAEADFASPLPTSTARFSPVTDG